MSLSNHLYFVMSNAIDLNFFFQSIVFQCFLVQSKCLATQDSSKSQLFPVIVGFYCVIV